MIRRNLVCPLALLSLVVFLGAGLGAALAQTSGGTRIDITPRRIILESRDRTGELTLVNMGNQEGTFRIEVLNYRQSADGTYATLDGPLDPRFNPDDILRLSPRQFTIPAGGRQKVRFSLRKPADLPEGEYRFHLLATRVTEMGPPVPVESGERRVSVLTNIATAIPVVVRHGSLTVEASLHNLRYIPADQDGNPAMEFTIRRSGSAGTIGTVRAYWYPQSGQPSEIGVLRNTNLFSELSERTLTMPLQSAPSGHGRIRLVYLNDEGSGTYAEADLSL